MRDVPGFFDRTRHRIAGAERTLDDVENRILRPRFHDARVHVAINCAARSCPPLHGHAFRAETLDATLTQLARAFVASDRHVRIAGTRVEVSALLFWFQADFERDAGGSRWTWLRRYDATNRLAALPPTTTLTQRDYDWALNAR